MKEGLHWIGSRVYVPDIKEVKRILLQLAHSCPIAGHRGIKGTWLALSRRFVWDGLRGDVEEYVAACSSCQRAKRRTTKRNGLLQPLPIASGPWTSIEMDHIGGFPEVGGYNSLLVVSDRFTKRVHLIPAHSTDTAQDLAKQFLREVYRLHGAPSEIISDRGSTFIASFWEEVQRLLGISTHHGIAYHHEGQGQVERCNHTVEEVLRIWVNRAQDDWPDWLSVVEFSINNAVSSATGFSPFELDAGVAPFRGDSLDAICNVDKKSSAFSWASRFIEMRDMAMSILERQQQRMKDRADKTRRAWLPNVGDRVFVSSETLSLSGGPMKKLRPLFVILM